MNFDQIEERREAVTGLAYEDYRARLLAQDDFEEDDFYEQELELWDSREKDEPCDD